MALGVLLPVFGLCAQKPLEIAAPHISSLLEYDQSGIYQRILSRALARIDEEVTQEVFPYKRGLRAFEQHQVDCVYAFNDVITERMGPRRVITSYPLGAYRFYIFTRKDSPVLTSPEQLRGLRVGGVIGQEDFFRKVVGPDLNLTLVSRDEQIVQLLNYGRVDALIGALPDLSPYRDQLNYSPTNPIYTGYDRITCYNTPRNRQFVNALSRVLTELKKEGVYKQEAGALFVDFDIASN
ncbi:transporter substrate-binding domain-containing protein [Marinobacteraceae bacterium S3BR75-40.1]